MAEKRTVLQSLCDLTGKITGESVIGDQKVSSISHIEDVDKIILTLQDVTNNNYGKDLLKWVEWYMPHCSGDREKMILQFIKVKGQLIKIDNNSD
ncbi:MAG: hypothetical protein OQK95_03205 [Gammaproteobacteria bacterium]|nr:hypothetical protein [Gammaproteobacteria bacterium]